MKTPPHRKALSVSNEANPDVSASMVVAVSLLMALYVKKKTGKGQYVEPTMVGTGLFVNSDDYVQFPGKPSRRLPDPTSSAFTPLPHV